MIFKLTRSYHSDWVIYLFVFTFTDSLGRCGSNKDGKTQKEDLELLVEEKRKRIRYFFSSGGDWKSNQNGYGHGHALNLIKEDHRGQKRNQGRHGFYSAFLFVDNAGERIYWTGKWNNSCTTLHDMHACYTLWVTINFLTKTYHFSTLVRVWRQVFVRLLAGTCAFLANPRVNLFYTIWQQSSVSSYSIWYQGPIGIKHLSARLMRHWHRIRVNNHVFQWQFSGLNLSCPRNGFFLEQNWFICTI